MLVLSAGLKLSRSRLGYAGGIGLLVLELGGCMTLGDATPPPSRADANSLPGVNAPAPAINNSVPVTDASAVAASASVASRAARIVPRVKKAARDRRFAEVSRDRPSSIDPDRLIGLAPAAVKQLLGPPVRVEDDELSREWVYASNGCSFRLFFYPNLNTASFQVLKYGGNDGNGDLMDVTDVCIRKILTARKNATG